MMKLTWFVVVALVLAMCTAVCAQGPSAQKLTISPEYFYLLDSDARDFLGGGLGVTVGYRVGEDASEPMYLSVGYISFSKTGTYDTGEGILEYDTDATVMPFMLTKYYSPETASANKLYYGVGAGVVRTEIETATSATHTDFAWQLVGGMNFNQKWFGEIKYFNGSEDPNTGITASVGARF